MKLIKNNKIILGFLIIFIIVSFINVSNDTVNIFVNIIVGLSIFSVVITNYITYSKVFLINLVIVGLNFAMNIILTKKILFTQDVFNNINLFNFGTKFSITEEVFLILFAIVIFKFILDILKSYPQISATYLLEEMFEKSNLKQKFSNDLLDIEEILPKYEKQLIFFSGLDGISQICKIYIIINISLFIVNVFLSKITNLSNVNYIINMEYVSLFSIYVLVFQISSLIIKNSDNVHNLFNKYLKITYIGFSVFLLSIFLSLHCLFYFGIMFVLSGILLHVFKINKGLI